VPTLRVVQKRSPRFRSCGGRFTPLPVIPAFLIALHMFLKVMTWPNQEGKVCLKSKASAPGMGRPIRRDAGMLCDQADLS